MQPEEPQGAETVAGRDPAPGVSDAQAGAQAGAQSGSWAGAVAAMFGLGSLLFHMPALAAAALLPVVVDLVAGMAVRQGLESGLPAAGPDAFDAVRGALADVGPPTLAALGLAVILAVIVLFGGVGLTFGRRFARRLLRVALAVEGLRALVWALLVSASLGETARSGAAAFDAALAPLGMRGAGMDQPGVLEHVVMWTSPLATWGPALFQAAIVSGLFVWCGSRAARVYTGELSEDRGPGD